MSAFMYYSSIIANINISIHYNYDNFTDDFENFKINSTERYENLIGITFFSTPVENEIRINFLVQKYIFFNLKFTLFF